MSDSMLKKIFRNRWQWQMWLRLALYPVAIIFGIIAFAANAIFDAIDKLPRVPK
jgi:NhaP-type Na+/H+ or K+/H+ antiporter